MILMILRIQGRQSLRYRVISNVMLFTYDNLLIYIVEIQRNIFVLAHNLIDHLYFFINPLNRMINRVHFRYQMIRLWNLYWIFLTWTATMDWPIFIARTLIQCDEFLRILMVWIESLFWWNLTHARHGLSSISIKWGWYLGLLLILNRGFGVLVNTTGIRWHLFNFRILSRNLFQF